MYITQYWLPSRGRINLLQRYYTRNDDLQPFKLSILNYTSYIFDILVLSRSLRKQDILAQSSIRKQDNDG